MTKVFGIIIFVGLCLFIGYELYSLVRSIIVAVKERKAQKSVSTASSEAQDKSNKEV